MKLLEEWMMWQCCGSWGQPATLSCRLLVAAGWRVQQHPPMESTATPWYPIDQHDVKRSCCTLAGRTFNAGASFLQLNLDDRATQAAEVLSRAARKTHDARQGKRGNQMDPWPVLKVQILVELVELEISIKSSYHQTNYICINSSNTRSHDPKELIILF